MTRAALQHADRLKVISKWGVGVDNIDLAAAEELGIRVTNTPGMFGDEVADVAIGYLILLARHLHRVDRDVRDGQWPKPEGVSLAGRTMGVVGLGHIGQAVAKRAQAMGMQVMGTDVSTESAAVAERSGVKIVDLSELLREADVVSLNSPLTAENRHMINESTLATMKPGAWIVNTARGGLIDEDALVSALESGQVGAAALDVFEIEPLPARSPLRRIPQVILGAHNGSNTADAVHRTSVRAIDNLIAGLEGGAD
jgi:D-3-phosphoglycerate dehydrogenase